MTYASFVSTLAGLTVTGVKRAYTAPPTVDTSANYPIMFPRLPTASREAVSLASSAGLRSVTCDLVVVLARDVLDTSTARFATATALIDALDTALATEMAAHNQIDRWEIRPEVNEYGWSLIATVEASE